MLWLVSFAFSKEEEEEEEEEDEEEEEEEHGQSMKIMFACNMFSCDIFIQFFAGSYFFTCSPPWCP